jgi:hypothetical protein
MRSDAPAIESRGDRAQRGRGYFCDVLGIGLRGGTDVAAKLSNNSKEER